MNHYDIAALDVEQALKLLHDLVERDCLQNSG